MESFLAMVLHEAQPMTLTEDARTSDMLARKAIQFILVHVTTGAPQKHLIKDRRGTGFHKVFPHREPNQPMLN